MKLLRNNITKTLTIAIGALIFFFNDFNAFAQTSTKLSGTITDEQTGEAIIGALVSLEGTSLGAISDFDGKYNLETNLEGEHILKVSFLGFSTIEEPVVLGQGDISRDFQMSADLVGLDVVIVTGNTDPKTAIESSISVSSIRTDQFNQAAPRSTAEIFRNLPGVKTEATGGEGNANITVRGIPIATGGAKFLQLHEDGLPVMQFGDISFGNADIFLRADNTIDRIEALRGGSASVLSSNSPAGVINFISKSGKVEGGSVGTTVGMDYNTFRTDFEYGAPIGEDMNFHIGGFWRQGEGPRDAGYNANSGGQIKANLTKKFDKGFVRLYFKHLNDRSIGYLPMPVQVTGSNSSPVLGNVNNFNALSGTPHSPYLMTNLSMGADGNLRRSSIQEGMNPISTAIGGEFNFYLGNDWSIVNKFRQQFNTGRFVSPFPSEVADAQSMANSIGGDNSVLSYANGPNAGNVINNPSALNGNGLAMRIHLFDVDFNNFNNFSNDLQLSKEMDNVNFTFGFYKGIQHINMSWLWNSYLMEVNSTNAALLDVSSADGNTTFTENGLIAYGVPFWDNCCTRNYDAVYDVNAPYVNTSFEFGDLSVDAGLRYDYGSAFGTYAGAVQSAIDMNRDGMISVPEQSVSSVDNANANPINYDWSYLSYSLGLNYKISDSQAAFARYSRGGRANADRLLFGPGIAADGSAVGGLNSDMVTQMEAGFKYKSPKIGIFGTAFYSNLEEQNFEATTQQFFDREYTALGLELETAARFGKFDVRGSVTWTNAEISKDKLNPEIEGNTPRRQADFIYYLTPSYNFKKGTVGFNLIGTTDMYAQDNNDLVMPGYTQVNAFAYYDIVEGLSIGVNSNNLFNAFGLTESEEGSITDGVTNVIRARSINGRTTSVTLKFKF
ncbi:TonB-dependent receptor [Cyclobacterium sediminis]